MTMELFDTLASSVTRIKVRLGACNDKNIRIPSVNSNKSKNYRYNILNGACIKIFISCNFLAVDINFLAVDIYSQLVHNFISILSFSILERFLTALTAESRFFMSWEDGLVFSDEEGRSPARFQENKKMRIFRELVRK